MLQTGVPEVAGVLGAQLCALAGGKLTKAFFATSGSEGVEAAIKFSRADTGRVGMLSAKGSFHGLTCRNDAPQGLDRGARNGPPCYQFHLKRLTC